MSVDLFEQQSDGKRGGMTVLVLAAHPDDEVLGCGGAIARHTEAGDAVHTVFIADGETSRGDGAAAKDRVRAREDMARKAADVLGAAPPVFLRFPDNRLDTVPLLEIAQGIEEQVRSVQPHCVYTHSAADMNVDHRLTHQAARTALRPQAGMSAVRILGFEIPSSTEWGGSGFGPVFEPTVGIDATPYIERKLAALGCYEPELRQMPHPRSKVAIEALMQWRGAQFGMLHAEAFELIREITR